MGRKVAVQNEALEVSMRALDRSILVGDTGIVARRHHAVVGDELLITPRQVLLSIAIEIPEGG